MIQKGTVLNIIDNSGARYVYCIDIITGFKRKWAYLGDIIKVVIYSLRKRRRFESKVQKGEIYKALVVRTKIAYKYKSNDSIFFLENSAILLNDNHKIIGTRIFGFVPKILRKTRFMRVISTAKGFKW